MSQVSLTKYLDGKIKPYIKPNLNATFKKFKEQERGAKENLLSIYIPCVRNGKIITKVTRKLLEESSKDLKKYGIRSEIIHIPMTFETEYDCSYCRKYKECDSIYYLQIISQIKEKYPRKIKNNINKWKISDLWRLYRIKQKNCVKKKLSYIEYLEGKSEWHEYW